LPIHYPRRAPRKRAAPRVSVEEPQPYLPPVLPEVVDRSQLPGDVHRLIGRDDEMELLRRHLRQSPPTPHRARIIVIHGKPGVGKSALAIHLAHELKGEYPYAQLYARLLGGVWPPGEARQPTNQESAGPAEEGRGPAHQDADPEFFDDFLRVLDQEGRTAPETLQAKIRRYRELTRGKKLLILLDGMTSAEQVTPLLTADSSTLVIVTSRSSLNSLNAFDLALDVLDERSAVELLGTYARGEESKIEQEPSAAAEVVSRCGHLPLAIVIAGARLGTRRDWSVQSLASKLANPDTILNELSDEVSRSFSLSYDELSPGEKALFRRSSAFNGPHFEAQAAAELSALPPDQAARTLEKLADLALLELAGPEDCYKFHDLLKSFAKRCFEVEETDHDKKQCIRAILDYYHARIKEADDSLQPMTEPPAPPTADSRKMNALLWLTQERENLVAIVYQALAESYPDIAWKVAARLASFFDVRGHYDDWRDTHQAVLPMLEGDEWLLARAVVTRSLGRMYHDQHKWDDARQEYKEALGLFHRLRHRRDVGVTLLYLGDVYRYQRSWDSARNTLTAGRQILREERFRRGEAIAMRSLGAVLCLTGTYDEAIRLYEQALQIFAELDDQRWMAATKLSISDVYADRKLPQLSLPLLRECRKVFQDYGDLHWLALTWRSLGQSLAESGDFASAHEALDKGLKMLRELEDPQWEGAVLETRGEVYALEGRWAEAKTCYEECIRILAKGEDRLWEARARKNLGIALRQMGDRAQAESEWSSAWLAFMEQNALEANEVDRLLYDTPDDALDP
jgi:tetratricopeptide (TPR) repeat protein